LSEIAQGLQLSVMGILITFASLGLLIVVMILLRELFNPKPKDVAEESPTKEAQLDIQSAASDKDETRQRAAGIAVAVAFLASQRKRGATLGQLLETPPGHWWSASKRSQNE
jgi:sodium pump decarboxylase gamma subunit